MNRLGIMAAAALIAVGLGVQSPAAAQSRQQRLNPAQRQAPETSAQTRVLVDRFSRRAADALRLDDAGARRLNEELRRFLDERQELMRRRRALRQELDRVVRGTPADESRVGELLEELMRIELRQAELNIEEQRRLAEFMTPLQRARLLYLRQRLAQQAIRTPRERADTDPPPRGVQPRDTTGGESDSPERSSGSLWNPLGL